MSAAASRRKSLHASNYFLIRNVLERMLAQHHVGDYLLAEVFDQVQVSTTFRELVGELGPIAADGVN